MFFVIIVYDMTGFFFSAFSLGLFVCRMFLRLLPRIKMRFFLITIYVVTIFIFKIQTQVFLYRNNVWGY